VEDFELSPSVLKYDGRSIAGLETQRAKTFWALHQQTVLEYNKIESFVSNCLNLL
jgi:hypothetical protein